MMDLIDFDSGSNQPRLIEVEMHPVSAAYHQHSHQDFLEPTKTGSFRRVNGEEGAFRTDSSQENHTGYDEELDSSSELPSYSPVPSESASVSWLTNPLPQSRGTHNIDEHAGDRSDTTTPDLLSSSSPIGESKTEGRRGGSSQREEVSQFETSDYVGSTDSSKDEVQSVCSYSSASLPSTSPDLAQIPTPLPVGQDVPLRRQASVKSQSSTGDETGSPTRRNRVIPENETPIEREIRLAKRREEEQRRHNEQQRRQMDKEEGRDGTSFLDKSPNDKKQARWSVHIPLDKLPYNDTQRLLATSRLQQEIEEQKRREMELRRDGRVMSISEDRVDDQSPLTSRHGSSDDNTEDDEAITASSGNTPQPQHGIGSQRAFFEQGSSSKVAAKEQGDDGNSHQTIIRQASHPKGGQLPLRTNTSSSSVTSVTAPVVSEKSPAVASTTKMPLSTMQRFISNRGKLPGIMPSRISTTKLSQESSMTSLNDDKGVYVDYTAVRRPASQTQQEMPKSDQDDDLASAVKKIYRSAKSKIFDELQEMQRREEELRQTRQDLGLPGLSLEMGKENEHEPTTNADQVSRPQDIIVQEIAQIPVGRQSALLAQWEARITSAQAD